MRFQYSIAQSGSVHNCMYNAMDPSSIMKYSAENCRSHIPQCNGRKLNYGQYELNYGLDFLTLLKSQVTALLPKMKIVGHAISLRRLVLAPNTEFYLNSHRN